MFFADDNPLQRDSLEWILALGRLTLCSVALLLFYFVLDRGIVAIAQIPEASYFQPILLFELVRKLGPIQLGGLVVLLGYLVWTRTAGQRWVDINDGLLWRRWILLILAVLTWTFVTYEHNYYFNQGHLVDRFALLLLLALIVWRPIFLLPYALLVLTIALQFHYPIGGDSLAEQSVLIRILVLFVAVFWFPLPAWRRSAHFAFLVLTLLATSYWWPGLGKLRLLWFTHGHLYYLLPAAFASGWLGTFSATTIERFAELLRTVDPIVVAFTLACECGAIFFLWRRSLTLALLCGWVALHLGIAAVSGIFFWKWIVLDLGLLWLLVTQRHTKLFPVFTVQHFLLSILLIGGGKIWFGAVNFAWYDTPINYAYRIEAVGQSGHIYQLPARFFAPYEYQFSLGAFGYANREPRLNLIYGAVWEREIATELLDVTTPDEFFALEAARGQVQVDTQRSEKLKIFLQNFVGNGNQRTQRFAWARVLQAPSQLLSLPYFPAFRGQEPIRTVTVHQITSLYSAGRYQEIRDQLVAEVEIPDFVDRVRSE